MDKCFVIQPFDKGKYDSRYEDIFKQNIIDCGLIPYRVDKDPGASILIEDIEKNIREARICLAEITTDNPNVWYELGYAMAYNKEIVMVCSNERNTGFPFDVRHRNIIMYKTESPRDFIKLGDDIKERIKAILQKQDSFQTISKSVIKEKEGLSHHEITALVSIMSNQFSDNEVVWRYTLEQDMHNNGYNSLAVSIAIKKLKARQFIELGSEPDEEGRPITYFRITKAGEDWIIANEDRLSLKITESENYNENDDLPF